LKIEPQIVYISQSKNLSDLKDKICSFDQIKKIYSSDLTKDNIRLWKINANASQQEIFKSIAEIQPDNRNAISVDFLSYLECIFL
jgi:hypothetical protein